MEYISMILLVIVLVAQIALFILFFLEKRYVNQRFTAMLQYIDRKIKDADCREEIAQNVKEQLDDFSNKFSERMEEYVSEQVKGMALDFTEAQAAANKINDFATNLSSIFDYDPIAAIKKGRNREVG